MSSCHCTRRHFLARGGAGMLAVGLALAACALPARAAPEEEPVTGRAVLPVKGREIAVDWARPRGAGPFSVVLVVHDVSGVREPEREAARRLAKLGYLAVVPTLVQGLVQASPSEETGPPAEATVPAARSPGRALAAGEAEAARSTLDAALAWSRRESGDTSRVGIVGFGWGGRIARSYCEYNPTLRAGIDWDGPAASEPPRGTGPRAAERAAGPRVPVLALCEGASPGCLPAAEAWRRQIDWLREHGV